MAGTSIVTLSPDDVVMKYREAFLTKSLNEKSAVNTAPGIYRGFRLGPNAGMMLVTIVADVDHFDHSAVYETNAGLSMTVARRGSFSIDLTPFAGKTVVVALFASYSVGVDTFAEVRVYELAPTDELSGSPEEDEIVIMGTVVVPALAMVIPSTDITNDRRSSAWLSVAPDAIAWAPLLRNRGFEWGPIATGVGKYDAAYWQFETDSNGRWDLSTGNPHAGLKHLEYTRLGMGSVALAMQQVNVPVREDQLLRVQFFSQLVQLVTGGQIRFLVQYTGADGNVVGSDTILIADPSSPVQLIYEKLERIFIVPANATHISRIGFLLLAVDAALAAPMWRVDSADAWLETTALAPYTFQERKSAQVVESLVVRDATGDFDDEEAVIDFDKDTPPGEGTLSIGRRDQASALHPVLSFLGTISGLGNSHAASPTQAERARISSTWAEFADSPYTLAWEFADPNSSLLKTRIYVGPGGAGNFTVTSNARWDATAAEWNRDQANRAATKLSLDRAEVKFESVTPLFPGPWADTAWERSSFEHDTIGRTKLSGQTTMGEDIQATDADAATPRIIMERASDGAVAAGRTLMWEMNVPTVMGTFYPIRIYRAYRVSFGTGDTLEVVSNALWDPVASMWSMDNATGGPLASKFTIMNDRYIFQSRDTTVDWADNAWEFNDSHALNSLGSTNLSDNWRLFIQNSGVQTNPASTTFQTNVICAKNTCKCWGHVTTGAGGPIVVDGYNITSVAYSGDEVLVTIGGDMANMDYCVVATSSGSLGSIDSVNPGIVSAGTFTLRVNRVQFNAGGNIINGSAGIMDLSTNSRRLWFAVYGVQNS